MDVNRKTALEIFQNLLAKLPPIVDNGVLRVGGRLQRSLLSYDKKHPMILPPSHHFTELVIRHYHEEDGHLGTNHVLSRTREKFWIMKGQSAVRKVLNKCVYCTANACKAQAALNICRIFLNLESSLGGRRSTTLW